MKFEDNIASDISDNLEEELINSFKRNDLNIYDDEIKKILCLDSINSAVVSSGLIDYEIKIDKNTSKNIYNSYHYNISFDSGTAFNNDIYKIVLDNCKKYEMKNFIFTISKKIDDNQSGDNNNPVNNSARIYSENDRVSYQLEQILDHGRFFKNTIISRSNCPIGNLSDYLLISAYKSEDINAESVIGVNHSSKVSEL